VPSLRNEDGSIGAECVGDGVVVECREGG
jgi:hypothetical protein